MLSIVSNNYGASKVRKVSYARTGITDEENAQLLRDYPEGEIAQATSAFRVTIPHEEELPEEICPSVVSKYMGAFSLAVSNQGSSLESAVIVFNLSPIEDKPLETVNGIIVEDPLDMTERSIAVLPFLEVFKPQIEAEAQKADDLINKAKGNQPIQLDDVRADRDRKLVIEMSSGFFNILSRSESGGGVQSLVGQEAVADSLASSLSAQKAFYNALWEQLNSVYGDSCRYIGEQFALGNITIGTSGVSGVYSSSSIITPISVINPQREPSEDELNEEGQMTKAKPEGWLGPN